MPRSRRRRSSRSRYLDWLIAAIATLLIALVVTTLALWPREGFSSAEQLPAPSVVTLPSSVPSTTTTTLGPATTTTLTPTTQTAPPTTAPPTTAPPTPAAPPPAAPSLTFDGALAMGHLQALASGIGPRKSGTDAEDAAISYASDYLHSLGYQVVTTDVALPSGEVSHNVRATKGGASSSVILIGAHIDCKATAPGGNDNASGVAVVLELARDLLAAGTVPTLQFALFGAEEMTDSNPDHHHYGSRQLLAGMTAAERAALVGMISADMVGYGTKFHVRTMNKGPQLLRDMVKTFSNESGLTTTYLRDPGTYGYSDHEPFELAGYPAVWVEWREDPLYHTAGDTYGHCDPSDVQRAGQMLVQFLAQLDQADLDALAAARTLH
jgi:hypothetical protein